MDCQSRSWLPWWFDVSCSVFDRPLAAEMTMMCMQQFGLRSQLICSGSCYPLIRCRLGALIKKDTRRLALFADSKAWQILPCALRWIVMISLAESTLGFLRRGSLSLCPLFASAHLLVDSFISICLVGLPFFFLLL